MRTAKDRDTAEPLVHWVYGVHAVAACLAMRDPLVQELWLSDRKLTAELADLREQAELFGVPVVRKNRQQMDVAVGGVHQGVALKCRIAEPRGEQDLEQLLELNRAATLLLVLDGVTDPRNFGACLRSAEALGVTAVVVHRHGSAPLNGAAIKAASGAAQRLPVIEVVNVARTLGWLKQWGMRIIGTSVDEGQTLAELDLTGPLALVMGSEDKGIRRLTRERCDLLASIPLANRQLSLNVSVATGICLYEIDCQRRSSRSS